MNTDLIIIGAGPGGYETALKAAKSGLQVVIIEKAQLGGTCLNAGCIPTKCLCHSAELLENARELGLEAPGLEYLERAMAHKAEVVDKLRAGIAMLMKTPGITLVEGEARFVNAHTVEVKSTLRSTQTDACCSKNSQDLQPTTQNLQPVVQYSAPNIIIATGSVTKFLPIEGAHAEGVLTSTEMLDLPTQDSSLFTLHSSLKLCIIGGGVIGMEFASIFNSFGAQVDVVEFCKEILPPFDKDIAKRLRTSLKKKGINFHVGAGAKSIKTIHNSESTIHNSESTIHNSESTIHNEKLVVTFEEKGKEQSIECDRVLMAVGRAANVQAINLDDIQVEYTPRGIKVDENMQTNIPGVYAIGDVNGLCQLAHAATFQGYTALEHILESALPDHSAQCDACISKNRRTTEPSSLPLKGIGGSLSIIPSAVFTSPEAAMVGATEETLTAQGTEYKVLKSFYRANGKALSMDADDGLVKILVAPDGKILGAHILGAHASDLIHEIAIVMQMEGTVNDIAHTVHAHPSLSEIILAAAEA